jgi:sortase A
MKRRVALASLATLALVACGNDEPQAAPTVAPSTTRATTSTSSSSTTSSTTTTLPPTTTTEPLPVPLPPPDPHADEPIVEVGIIEIPKIEVTKTMFEGVSLTVLDHGPGHWPGTAMPGHRGNVVIAGHRTSHDRPFRRLDELVPGDEMFLSTLEGRFRYLVVSTEVVDPTAIRIIEQRDGHTATLFACHPPGSTKERIVVQLELAD